MTKFVKKSEINCKWYEIDAKNAVVGRLATIITKIIRGKNNPKFSPHMDHGDFVVVKNIENISPGFKGSSTKGVLPLDVPDFGLRKCDSITRVKTKNEIGMINRIGPRFYCNFNRNNSNFQRSSVDLIKPIQVSGFIFLN